jgi:hypothetical protein
MLFSYVRSCPGYRNLRGAIWSAAAVNTTLHKLPVEVLCANRSTQPGTWAEDCVLAREFEPATQRSWLVSREILQELFASRVAE